MNHYHLLLSSCVMAIACCTQGFAAEWPCWGGPSGSHAVHTGIALIDDINTARQVWKSEALIPHSCPQIKKTPPNRRSVPETRHLRLLAGGHVYGIQRRGGRRGKPGSVEMSVHAADGTRVGTSTLPGMSYGCAYTFGPKAIYIRMDTELIKIGE